MKVILRAEVAEKTSEIRLKPNRSCRVGSSDAADFVIQGDSLLDLLHFEVETTEQECRVRNLSKKELFVNGKQVSEEVLRSGDYIVAGNTLFPVKIILPKPAPILSSAAISGVSTASAALSPAPSVASPNKAKEDSLFAKGSPHDRLHHYILQEQPLFAILDSAVDPAILTMLENSEEAYESLYDGEKGDQMASAAPYLLQLTPECGLIKQLIEKGWGKNWGVYLRSTLEFDEVRKHLRQFLMVQMEDGPVVYFRFYDPRILRKFLPACTPEEARQFFGPLLSYFMEAEKPQEILFFSMNDTGLLKQSISLE